MKGKRAPTFEEINSLLIEAKYEDMRLRDKTARDEGTCVMGAGIVVRDPASLQQVVLIPAPFQGNVGSYRALKPVLEALQKKHPKLWIAWYDGIMD